MSCYIDTVREDDLSQVARCLKRNGLHRSGSEDELQKYLYWKYFENPIFERSQYTQCAKGFVVRDSGLVHGFIGSCPRLCFNGTDPFLMVVNGDIAVDAEYRNTSSIKLITRYANQPGASIYIGGTNNQIAAKLFQKLFHFLPYPDDRFAKSHIGIFSMYSSVLRIAEKIKLPLSLVKPFAAMVFKPYDFLHNRKILNEFPGMQWTKPRVFYSVNNDLGKFNERFLANNKHIVTERSVESLKWMLDEKLASKKCVIIAREDEDGIVGYTVLEKKVSLSYYTKYEMIDWVAVSLDEKILEQLLMDACHFCIEQKATCLQSVGFPIGYQKLLSKYLSTRLDIGVNRCTYKMSDEKLTAIVDKDINKWFVAIFDTDWALGS